MYRLGTYSLDIAMRELRRDGQRVDLPAKVFDCIAYLIEHRDRAVGRDELISAVWGRVDISDNLLAQIVLRARRTFSDDAGAQRYIRTIAGFGYRWVHEFDIDLPNVIETAQSTDIELPVVMEAPPPASKAKSRRGFPTRRRFAAVAGLLAVASIIAVTIYAGRSRHPMPVSQKGLALVLPASVADAPDTAWARLGVMDLIGQRLRESGQSTVPNETVVALAKSISAEASAVELSDMAATTGAGVFVQPVILRQSGQWRVILRRVHDKTSDVSFQADSSDLIVAANTAAARLITSIDASTPVLDEGADPVATIAQQIASDLLLDRSEDARKLIESAPVEVRTDPRFRLASARVYLSLSQLARAREELLALAGEKRTESSPEFKARVSLALSSIGVRSGDYAMSRRYANEVVQLTRELDTAIGRDVLGAGLLMQATAEAAQGDYDDAQDDFSKSRFVLSTVGDVQRLALVDSNLAMMQTLRDRFDLALAPLKNAAEYFKRLGATANELNNRTQVGATQLALQDFAGAADEDSKLAELIPRVDDPGVKVAAEEIRGEIALMQGRLSDAAAILDPLIGREGVPDNVKGLALVARARLESERGAYASAATSARAALALSWADEQPREYATAWLLLARMERRDSIARADDASVRARSWGATSIYPVAGVLVRLLEAEQLAARGMNVPASAAFEQALTQASIRAVPTDLVEITTAYATWLINKGDLDRALAVLGRTHAWAGSNFRVAVAEARLFKARGDQELWADALRRARQTAGERTVPAELLTFPSRDKS